MRWTSIIVAILLTVSYVRGQEYFNKRYSLGQVWPTFEYVDVKNDLIYLVGQTNIPNADSTFKWRYHYTTVDLKGEIQWTFTPELDSSIFNVYPFGIKVTEEGDIVTPHRREGLFVLKYHIGRDSFSYNQLDSETNPNDFFAVIEMLELENGNLAFLISESPDSTSGQSDPTVVIMDQDLNVIWRKSYLLSRVHDTPSSIIEDGDELVISYQYSNSFYNVRLNKFYHLGILRINKHNGNIIQSLIIDDIDMHGRPYDLVKDLQGDFYIASSLLTLDTIYLGGRPEERPVTRPQLLKLNSDFEIEWNYTFASDTIIEGGWCTLYDLAMAPNEQDIVAGGMIQTVDHELSDTVRQLLDLKGILSKFTADGEHLWTRTFVGIDSGWVYNFIHFVEPSPDGGYILGGRSVERNTKSTEDPKLAWLVKVDEHGCLVPGCHLPLNTSTNETPALDIRVHPNPTPDILHIFQNNALEISFSIIDKNGRAKLKFDNSTRGETISVNIQNWPKGTYQIFAKSKTGHHWSQSFLKI